MTRINQKRVRWFASVITAASLFVGIFPPPAQAQGPEVKFAWVKVLSGPAAFLLPEFAKKQGVSVNLLEFKRYPDIRTALTTGSADIGMIGVQEVPLVLGGGATNLVVVAGLEQGGTGLVARKGVAIAKWTDLYGKRIAAGRGGAAWTQFVASTTENGIDYSKLDVSNIVGGGFDHVRALERGDVDVVVSWEPYMAAAVAKGVAHYLPLDINSSKAAGAHVAVIATTKKFAAEHPELVGRVVKSLLDSTEHLRARPEKWVEVLAGWGFDTQTGSLAIKNIRLDPNLYQDRIEDLARFLFKVGLAKRDTSNELFPGYFTYDFLQRASGKPPQALGATK